ncbi:uncharacterized protein LOC136093878 [Hydra vulgaris]|uniref:uncharacterized protein LOC136093878 n=1 Tax=Hydra vulgaris TaxID=6087 RepID=UPI0032E9D5D5
MADLDGLDESVKKKKLFRHSSGGKILSISCNHVSGYCKVSFFGSSFIEIYTSVISFKFLYTQCKITWHSFSLWQNNHLLIDLFQARDITQDNLFKHHTEFYSIASKVSQDATILSMFNIINVKRVRVKYNNRKKLRTMSFDYFLCCKVIKVRVCQASFCSVLSIKPDRVLRIARHWYEHGTTRPENKGDRKKVAFSEKKEAIKNHIQSFTCRASHYGRKGAPGQIFAL